MRVLGLDIATRTGWCIGDIESDDLPVIGSFVLPSTSEDLGRYINAFHRMLLAKLEREWQGVQGVVFESPVLPFNSGGRGTSLQATRKLNALAGHLEWLCLQKALPAYELAPSTVKKALVKGNASKGDMMSAACRAGLSPEYADEADAFGVWLAALHRIRPERRAVWDARLATTSSLLRSVAP